MAELEQLLSRLDGVARAGKGWLARCPAHDDQHASLSLGASDDGRLLMKCHAGCDTREVLEALGLSFSDLFPKGGGGGLPSPESLQPCNRDAGCRLVDYAAAKRLPVKALTEFGVSEVSRLGRPALRMSYRQVDGGEAAIRFRIALDKGDDGDQRFAWRKGSKPLPYGLDRLGQARAAGYVVLVEGESDCHTLWFHGEPALGLPGATCWRHEWAAYLDEVPDVFLVVEPDQGGRKLLEAIERSPLRDRVRIIELGEHKDVSGLHVAAPELFSGRWRTVLQQAELLSTLQERAQRQQGEAAWQVCAHLAEAPDILARFDESLTRLGAVGERRPARLVFLAAVSRLFDRPISLAIKGPSSGGKSHIVASALRHFPDSAYYALTAMSDKALAYSEEPLRHRMLVIYEATGMESQTTSYLIRSLLSEGRIRYEFVDRPREGFRPRIITREGPTGLITTTTAVHLHPENETRYLSIPVTDTAEQTQAIMRAQARGHTSQPEVAPEWHALQLWLEAGERRVVVPFAERLAELVPPVAVRLRRDFPMLLTLIRAHALLHRANRGRTSAGEVIATIEDYAAVRELVADLMGVAVAQTVTPAVREAVETVARLAPRYPDGVPVMKVAAELKLDKSAALRRVKTAVAGGYLVNEENRRGRPARLTTGDPLPEARQLLPEPHVLAQGCTVAVNPERESTPLPPEGTAAEVDHARY